MVAVAVPTVAKQNTLREPVRQTGDTTADLLMVSRWQTQLYDLWSQTVQVEGTFLNHTARIANLEAQTGGGGGNPVLTFNARPGPAIVLTATDVDNALGFTPAPAYVLTSAAITAALGFAPGPVYTLPIATASVLGGIKPDGTTITVNPSTGVATASGASGALIKLASTTVSSPATEIDFLSIFSATYDQYLIEITGFTPSGTGADLGLQLGNAAGPTWETSANYNWGQVNAINNGGSQHTPGSNTGTSWVIFTAWNTGAATSRPAHASLTVKLPLSASFYPFLYGTAIYTDATAVSAGTTQCSLVQAPASHDSFRLVITAGTITAGAVVVYGVSK